MTTTIYGNQTNPNGGADAYPAGFTAGQRIQITADGWITKIGGWVRTSGTPTTEAFRFMIDRGSSTAVGTPREYYSSSDILLSSVATGSGDWSYTETLASPVAVSNGDYLWIEMVTAVAGDIRFIYNNVSGVFSIFDAYYGGVSLPPPSPLDSGSVSYYTDYAYGIWVEHETDIGGSYTPPLLLGALF